MKRLFMAVLFLTAATLLVPDLRERAAPHARAATGWTWDKVERPLSPVVNPFRRVKAQTEMGEIGRRLVNDRNRGLRPPEPHDFGAYILRHGLLADSTDPWGTGYRLRVEADSLALVSAGPDRVHGTDDDVVFKVYYPRRDPPRRIPFR
jgi:hypothetical protein